jgi:hypothetical protein
MPGEDAKRSPGAGLDATGVEWASTGRAKSTNVERARTMPRTGTIAWMETVERFLKE